MSYRFLAIASALVSITFGARFLLLDDMAEAQEAIPCMAECAGGCCEAEGWNCTIPQCNSVCYQYGANKNPPEYNHQCWSGWCENGDGGGALCCNATAKCAYKCYPDMNRMDVYHPCSPSGGPGCWVLNMEGERQHQRSVADKADVDRL
jgi:hypothetical protein